MKEGKASVENLTTVIKLAGAAIVTAFATGTLLSLVTAIGSLGRGIGLVAGALGGSSIAVWAASAFRALGPLMGGLRALAILISAGLGIYAASQLFDDFSEIAVNAIARVIEGLGDLAASMLNLPTDAIGALFGIKDPYGLGTGLKGLVEKARTERLAWEEVAKASKARQTFAKTDPRRVDIPKPAGDGKAAVVPVDTTAMDNAVRSVKEMTNEYLKQQGFSLRRLDIETELINKTDEQKQAVMQHMDLAKAFTDMQDQLLAKKASLTKEEGFLVPIINQQLAAIREMYGIQA
jgi:hypothetical protein